MKTPESNHTAPPDANRRAIAWRHDADILGVSADVYVLDDETRAISGRAAMHVLAGAPDHGHFGRFIARIAEDSGGFSVRPILRFRVPGRGRPLLGVEVTILADVAAAITDMKVAGALHASREHLVPRARLIEKVLGKLALIALVDEATGYQNRRSADALARKFAEYLLPEPGEWSPVFPQRFYVELARLYRTKLENDHERPVFFSKFTSRFIYDAIDRDVARELRARNPNPSHRSNHHQHLTPRARMVLAGHLLRVTTVMRQSASPEDFHRRFAHEFRGAGLQLPLGNVAA